VVHSARLNWFICCWCMYSDTSLAVYWMTRSAKITVYNFIQDFSLSFIAVKKAAVWTDNCEKFDVLLLLIKICFCWWKLSLHCTCVIYFASVCLYILLGHLLSVDIYTYRCLIIAFATEWVTLLLYHSLCWLWIINWQLSRLKLNINPLLHALFYCKASN